MPKTLGRYFRNKSFAMGLSIALAIVAVALIAQVYTPHDPNGIDIPRRLQAPAPGNWFGTDHFGRDVLSRVMGGALTALAVGFISTGIGFAVGIPVGAIAGYYRGWLDEILMRVMDGIYAFPSLLFAIMVVAMLGPGMFNTMIAVGVASIPGIARITRAGFLAVREKEFVEAATALGARNLRVIMTHILPNVTAPLIVQGTVRFAAAILAEAALSYLGLGTQPPDPSWGRMLRDAQPYLATASWTCMFPAAAIAVSVLGLNLLGDGLRDILDPRTGRKSRRG